MPKTLDPVKIAEEVCISAGQLCEAPQQDRKLPIRASKSEHIQLRIVLTIVNLVLCHILKCPEQEFHMAFWSHKHFENLRIFDWQ